MPVSIRSPGRLYLYNTSQNINMVNDDFKKFKVKVKADNENQKAEIEKLKFLLVLVICAFVGHVYYTQSTSYKVVNHEQKLEEIKKQFGEIGEKFDKVDKKMADNEGWTTTRFVITLLCGIGLLIGLFYLFYLISLLDARFKIFEGEFNRRFAQFEQQFDSFKSDVYRRFDNLKDTINDMKNQAVYNKKWGAAGSFVGGAVGGFVEVMGGFGGGFIGGIRGLFGKGK